MRDTRFDERLGRESERARARAKEPRKKQRESTYAARDEGRRLRVPAGDGEVVVAVQRLHFARFAVLKRHRPRAHARESSAWNQPILHANSSEFEWILSSD